MKKREGNQKLYLKLDDSTMELRKLVSGFKSVQWPLAELSVMLCFVFLFLCFSSLFSYFVLFLFFFFFKCESEYRVLGLYMLYVRDVVFHRITYYAIS